MTPLVIRVPNLVSIPDPLYDLTTLNVIQLGSRFYLKLYYPRSSSNRGSQIYYLPQSGITKHTLRLQLEPSTHSGINGCYKAEYWEYRPLEVKQPFPPNRAPKATERLVREEWWHIPTPHCSKGFVDLVRGESDDILPDCDGIAAIDAQVKVAGRYYGPSSYAVEAVPFQQRVGILERAPSISHFVVSWHPEGLAPGCPYRLEYQTPITLCAVLYRAYS